MSEMVERVARAIWALNEDTDCNDYDRLSVSAKSRAEEQARAAILAMRHTTLEMRADAQNAFMHGGGRLDDLWNAMIDSALKD